MTKPSWKQALKIMKALQNHYQLPIFAATFRGSCSCCADPCHLNQEAYLTPDLKSKSWDEIGAYILLSNSENADGEAYFGGDFGTVKDGKWIEVTPQYVRYRLSDQFTKEQLDECLITFVEALSELSETQYMVEIPHSTDECAIIRELKP